MSDANAKSSKRVTSFEKEVETIKLAMGLFRLNDKEYTLTMDPEDARTYTEQLMELVIPLGTFTKTIDRNGKIIAIKDNKTSENYVVAEKSVKEDVDKSSR